jgi:hypothetical protein
MAPPSQSLITKDLFWCIRFTSSSVTSRNRIGGGLDQNNFILRETRVEVE